MIINLTKKYILTADQTTILIKGLNFIPTVSTNREILEQAQFDLQQYHRRLKIATHYEHAPEKEQLPFLYKSAWAPPLASMPGEIQNLIKADMHTFKTQFKTHIVPSNITTSEKVALEQLKNNKEIIIKPADKGSAIVVMDREQYLWEGYRQLNDKKYYTKLSKPIYLDTVPSVHKIIESLYVKKFINAKQKAYLRGNSVPRARLFYMLPKIHKEPAKWSKPYEIPPGRPIVSDCSSETYHTAEYIDFFLNPLSTIHASYIKDTYHFVDLIKGLSIPVESILFTIDIDSLYTNIDLGEGMQAVKNIFQRNPDKRRPQKELLQLLEVNLTRNDFQFNEEWFLQTKGTAMGKKFAPAYANIFMAEWETSALKACTKRPLHYYRFLDDIWGVWTHSREDFIVFLATLHNHTLSIKIKSVDSLTAVDFLDTTTFKGDSFPQTHKLDIKVFFKPTDTHALLFKTSFHPKHTYAGLIKSQLLRFHRICTRKDDFLTAVRLLFTALSTRGYSRTFLRKCRKSFLSVKPILVTSSLPLITTFSPSTRHLVNEVRRNFKTHMEGTNTLQNHTIIPAYRRNRNLRDILIKAKITPLTHKTFRMGQYFKHKHWFRNNKTQEIFQTLAKGDIRTKNCVYLIYCSVCPLLYVGETGNTIATRFSQHKHNILKGKNTDTILVQHFMVHGWDALQASVIECNPYWSTAMRKFAERQWIKRLEAKDPGGLNGR